MSEMSDHLRDEEMRSVTQISEQLDERLTLNWYLSFILIKKHLMT